MPAGAGFAPTYLNLLLLLYSTIIQAFRLSAVIYDHPAMFFVFQRCKDKNYFSYIIQINLKII